MSAKGVFRQAALDKLASPEQLDQLMQITTLRSWLALGGIFLIVAGTITWSFVGEIPTKVNGKGLLIRKGAVLEVESSEAGQVLEIFVDIGDAVKKDAILAKIAQPKLESSLESARARLLELQNKFEQVEALGGADSKLRTEKLAQQRESLRDSIRAYKAQARTARERLASQRKLYKQGLITKQSLEATKESLQRIRENIAQTETQLRALSVSKLEVKSAREREELSLQHQINEADRGVKTLEADLERNSTIRSPDTGRVLEVRVSRGDLVRPGIPILNLELQTAQESDLEAILYVRAAEGKMIKSEMEVQISPSTVRKEEYGYMLGDVREVSKFSASRQGMLRVLVNEELVSEFLGMTGAGPIAVQVTLRRNSDSISGFQWSSGRGPELEINAGTLCDGLITVRKQRPIALLIPFFKTFLGI
ncbi:MAG: NHLP bacteriocin system secretion protein [Myxococcota bacterium]|jgi:HlyD family secretion protein|nr:NHLP bacteriocin system secretion protein [Myxococcota bacterium]